MNSQLPKPFSRLRLRRSEVNMAPKKPLEAVHSPTLRGFAHLTRTVSQLLVPSSTRTPDSGKDARLGSSLDSDPRILEANVKQRRAFGASLRLEVRLVLDAQYWHLSSTKLAQLTDIFSETPQVHAGRTFIDLTHPEDERQPEAAAAPEGNLAPTEAAEELREEIPVDPIVMLAGTIVPPPAREFIQQCVAAIAAHYPRWGQLALTIVFSLNGIRYRYDARVAGFPAAVITPAQLRALTAEA